TDGGATFTDLTLAGIPRTNNDEIDIVGIDASLVPYVEVHDVPATYGAVYKRIGTKWVPVIAKEDWLSLLIRKNGDLVAAAQRLGAWKSTDGGTTWQPLPSAPHLNCLVENGAGEVWGCTQNVGNSGLGLPSDGFGIMKSTDLQTWTGVLHYQDLLGPVE